MHKAKTQAERYGIFLSSRLDRLESCVMSTDALWTQLGLPVSVGRGDEEAGTDLDS